MSLGELVRGPWSIVAFGLLGWPWGARSGSGECRVCSPECTGAAPVGMEQDDNNDRMIRDQRNRTNTSNNLEPVSEPASALNPQPSGYRFDNI